MDAPLTTFKTTKWTNTPEARAELARTSEDRAILSEYWLNRQVTAELVRTLPLYGLSEIAETTPIIEPPKGDWYEDADFA